MKASLVHQAASSSYALTEVQLGGMLTRHDLSIQQVNLEMQLAFSCDRMLTWHQMQLFIITLLSGWSRDGNRDAELLAVRAFTAA